MEQFKSGLGPYGSSLIKVEKASFYTLKADGTQPKICRLCLSEIGNNFTLLEGVIKDMLEIILPELKLEICDAPAICCNCLETLKQSYNFKSSCLEAEDKVQGFINPKSPTLIDLKLVVSNKKNNMMPIDLGPQQCICRTCLNIVSNSSCTKLYSFEGDPLKNMIDKCLPEMGVELTKEPVICPICLEMLEEQFHFLMQCLDSEEKINYYCEKKHCHNKVDLRSVYLYSMCIDEDGNEQFEREGVSVVMDSVQSTSHQHILDASNNIIKSSKSNRQQIHTLIKNTAPIVQDVIQEDDDNISETISVTSIGDVFEMTIVPSEKGKLLENKLDINRQEKRPLQGKLVPKCMYSSKKEDSSSTPIKEEIIKTPVKEEHQFKKEEEPEDEESVSDEDFDDFAYYPNGPKRKAPKKCRHCDFKTKSFRSFKSHMSHKHPGKRLTRSDFNRRGSTSASESNTDVDGPENEINNKNFKCEKCGKKFETSRACKMHTTVMHTKLENNKKSSQISYELKQNDQTNSEISNPLLSNYMLFGSLNKNLNTENDPEKIPFKNESNAAKTPPQNIMKRPLPFKDGNMVKKATLVNKAPMPYSTKQTYRFDRHMLTMYKCRLCPYQTRLKSNFTKHQQTHKKINPSDIIKVHKCKIVNCSFETVQKESLLVHMKSHDVEPEEQLRKCFLCSFTTKKMDNLKKHVKEVHKAGSG